MSYKEFVSDLNDFYKDSNNKGTHYEIGQTIVRDNWIKNGRYDELIDFILENWDSGNCDEFIEPFEKKLIAESHISRLKRLWRRIIYYRLIKLTDTLNIYNEQNRKVDISALDKTDVSDFNMFSVDSYKDIKRVLAFRRQFLLSGIEKYKNGLIKLKEEKEILELNELDSGARNLDKTKLNPKKWR